MAGGSFHTGTIRKTVTINAPSGKVWRRASRIFELGWAKGASKTERLSARKSGVGAVRKITFDDGNTVEEHIIDWKRGSHFTYIATEGLPLRAYVATISLTPRDAKSTLVTWSSYLNSQRMPSRQFSELLTLMESFYESSLENLKRALE